MGNEHRYEYEELLAEVRTANSLIAACRVENHRQASEILQLKNDLQKKEQEINSERDIAFAATSQLHAEADRADMLEAQLKAAQEVIAATNPFYWQGQGRFCRYCSATQTATSEHHKENCVWDSFNNKDKDEG